jgi:hypothetical protein
MSTITTIQASDLITNSRTDINNNFSALNTDKIETSVIDTDTTLSANSDSRIPSQKAIKAYADAFASPINTVYPVGSIYLSTVATNPGTLFGIGTWSAYGAGRVLIGAGTGTVVATFASRASNVITVTGLTNAANNEFQTGQAVLYTAASGAMTGLTHNTTYYLIRTGNLTFSLASSLANAQNGTVISLSSDGTGTQTFTLTLTARTAGDTGGEENHAMSSSELLAHTHSAPVLTATGGSAANQSAHTVGTSGSTGGNAAMNIMQPFITCYMWLRTA